MSEKSNDQSPNTYALGTGELGAKGLALQQKYMAEATYKLLHEAGLTSGMVVCDMGCGSGEMTLYLAKQVGPAGHVYAVDVSEEQLEIVRKKVKESGLENVTCLRADVQDAAQLTMTNVDFVYSRLILMHLSDSQVALNNMYQLLKPSGVMTLQETTWEKIYTNYPTKLAYQFRDAIIKLGQSRGANYNIGRLLPKMCAALRNADVSSYEIEDKIKLWMFKDLMRFRLAETKDQLISSGMVSAELLQAWEQEYEAMPDHDDQYFVNPAAMTYVIVQKRG